MALDTRVVPAKPRPARRLRPRGKARRRPARRRAGSRSRRSCVARRAGRGVHRQGERAARAPHPRQDRRPARRADRPRAREGRGPHPRSAAQRRLPRRPARARRRRQVAGCLLAGRIPRARGAGPRRGRHPGRVQLRSLQEGEEAAQARPRLAAGRAEAAAGAGRGGAARLPDRRRGLRSPRGAWRPRAGCAAGCSAARRSASWA